MCAYHETLLVQDISNNPAIWPDGGGIGIFQLLYYTSATLRTTYYDYYYYTTNKRQPGIYCPDPQHICHWWPQKVQQKLDTLKNLPQQFLVYFQWNIETNLEKSMTERTLSYVQEIPSIQLDSFNNISLQKIYLNYLKNLKQEMLHKVSSWNFSTTLLFCVV